MVSFVFNVHHRKPGSVCAFEYFDHRGERRAYLFDQGVNVVRRVSRNRRGSFSGGCFFWSRSSVCGCAAAQHVSAAGVDMRPFRTHRQSSPGLGTAAAPYRVQHRTLHNARPAADGSPEVGDHPPVMVSLGTDRGRRPRAPASMTISAAARVVRRDLQPFRQIQDHGRRVSGSSSGSKG